MSQIVMPMVKTVRRVSGRSVGLGSAARTTSARVGGPGPGKSLGSIGSVGSVASRWRRIEEDSRVEDAGGVEGHLGRPEDVGEEPGTFPVVGRPVVAAHGVMVGGGTAAHCSSSAPGRPGAMTV